MAAEDFICGACFVLLTRKNIHIYIYTHTYIYILSFKKNAHSVFSSVLRLGVFLAFSMCVFEALLAMRFSDVLLAF